MSTKAKVLAILALPAGLVGYLVAGTVITNAGLQGSVGGLLFVFVPLFVAGLCMIPFIAPILDEMAKRDLAAAPPRHEGETSRHDAGTSRDDPALPRDDAETTEPRSGR